MNWFKNLFGKAEDQKVTSVLIPPVISTSQTVSSESSSKIESSQGSTPAVVSEPRTKEEFTMLGRPYINVDAIRINSENPKAGFCELDWNDYFITALRSNGYNGETEEEVVNLWFADFCAAMLRTEPEIQGKVYTGHINARDLGNNRKEFL